MQKLVMIIFSHSGQAFHCNGFENKHAKDKTTVGNVIKGRILQTEEVAVLFFEIS